MPQLGEFRTTVLDADGNAVLGASVGIYREGASVAGAQSGTSPFFTVTVRHPGKIKASDIVFIGTDTSTPYIASSVTSTTIVLTNFSGTLSLPNNARLIPGNNTPTVYQDDQGQVSSTNPLISDASGEAKGFLEYAAYDCVISGAGVNSELQEGVLVPTEAPGQVRYADAYAVGSVTGGIQEAIDSLPSEGGKVVCSAGRTYSLSSSTDSSASIWLHSGVELVIPAGCIVQRATGSSSAAIGVICAGPKGSNGTEFSSGSPGTNIRISGGGIIDGNQSNFTSNLGHGIRIKYVSGLVIDGVTVQNTEQDGVYLESPKNFRLSNLYLDTIGQATSVTQRNGISIYNSAATSGYGQHGTISNVVISTVGAAGASAVGEAISTINVADLAFSNITIDGCDYAIELNAKDTGTEWNRNLTFSNIVVKNARFTFITMLETVAAVWRNVAISNSTFDGHSTLHNGGALWVNVNTTGTFDGLTLSNCIFRNINTSDTANRSFVHYQSTTGAGSSGLTISSCQFHGKSGSTVLTGAGISLNGGLTDALITNVLAKNIPGIGFNIGGITAITSTARDIIFSNCIADTCTGDGFKVSAATVTTTQYDISFNGCVAKNCGISGNSSRAFFITTGAGAGSIVKNIHLSNCKAYQTTGTFMLYGVNLTATAASTLGPIYIDNCDFLEVQTAEIVTSGSINGIRCSGHLHGSQSIVAAGNTVSLPSKIKHCSIYLDADNTYTLTSTPTIPDGAFEGQRLYIMNVDTGSDIVRFQDEVANAGSNILTDGTGGGIFALDPGDNLTLMWSAGLSAWVQQAGQNTIA